MKRRDFFRVLGGGLSAGLLAGRAVAAEGDHRGAQFHTVEDLQRFGALKTGLFLHYGMMTYFDRPWRDYACVPAANFAPTDLSPEQWVELAVECGMKYAVLTTKHVLGFCLWPSKVSKYHVGDSGLKTDVVGRFTEACRKRGLQPCLYVNMLDIHKLCGPGTRFGRRFKDRKIKRDSPEYHEFQRAITKELVTTYKPYMVWYDGPPAPHGLYELCHELQPDLLVLVNQAFRDGTKVVKGRWPADIITGEVTLPPESGHDPWLTVDGKRYYVPLECCKQGTKRWFHSADNTPRPKEELVAFGSEALRRGANFLLNVPPDRTGRIPEATAAHVKDVMKAVARASNANGAVQDPEALR